MRKQVEALEDHADARASCQFAVTHVYAADAGQTLADRLAVNEDLTATRAFQPIDAAQQSGLAGARGTDDGHLVTESNLEVDALQNLERAEPLVQIDDPHKGLRVAHANSDEKSFSVPAGADRVIVGVPVHADPRVGFRRHLIVRVADAEFGKNVRSAWCATAISRPR